MFETVEVRGLTPGMQRFTERLRALATRLDVSPADDHDGFLIAGTDGVYYDVAELLNAFLDRLEAV